MSYLDVFRLIVEICGGISIVVAAAVILIKPLREKFIRDDMQREGMKCLLRGRMLTLYYKNKDIEKIRQYEYQNFVELHEAYKALNGNSFIDEIYEKIKDWDIES